MFKATNAYDEVVIKATDENLTSENWQLNLDVCDKVTAEGETGARNCVAAILKRLVHRNANVQLYALTLSDALSKNCGLVAHRELASRSYCQTLQRIVTDRNTHSSVKRKGLSLIKEWTSEWGNDESLGVMRETVDTLKRQGVSFEDEPRDPPPEPSSEQLRAEDEELRRVLELSLQDQGGRSGYQPSASSGATASSSTAQASSSAGAAVNKSLPDPASQATAAQAPQPQQTGPAASRVRALYDFVPSEDGELAFRKGDVIRVLDSVYEHWWRGELNGAAGIFPVNYVEILPDPSPADIQREAELEARIFAQAGDIDRLLSRLRGLDPMRDNLADDEELQELYQSSLSMRPKIVKLIDRYNLKVNELRTMNEKFVRARTTYDAMMQDSVQKRGPVAPGGYGRPDTLQPGHRIPSYGGGGGGMAAPGMYSNQNPAAGRPTSVQPQQQEYAEEWARQYAQQGYPAQQTPQAQAAPQQTPQLPPDAPPYGTAEYAQWYYAQQQRQGAAAGQSMSHANGQQQRQQQPGTAPPSVDGMQQPDDDEKRRMFERARAEAEAYHRAHQQGGQSYQPSYAQPPPPQQGPGPSMPSAPLL